MQLLKWGLMVLGIRMLKYKVQAIWYVLWPPAFYYCICMAVTFGFSWLIGPQDNVQTDALSWLERNWRLLAMLIAVIPAAAFTWWLYLRDQLRRRTLLRIQKVWRAQWCYPVILGICSCFCLNLLIMLFSPLMYSPGGEHVQDVIAQSSFLLQILYAVIVGPIAEEILFRGMVYGRLREFLTFWPTAAISALLFGIWHGNLAQFVYAVPMGFILAFLYEQYKGLTAPVLMHITANLCSLLVYRQVAVWLGKYPMAIFFLILLSVAGTVFSLWRIQNATEDLHIKSVDWSDLLKK